MKKISLALILNIGIGYSLFAQSTFVEFADSSAEKWYNKRVRNAKKGNREIVKIPMVVRSMGWGCTCPYYYMGAEPDYNSIGLWLSPITPKDFPVLDSLGHSLIVKGYFTGKTEKEEGDDTIIYIVPEFKIISWKKNENIDSIEAPRVIK